jgi:hypothetical protein
MCSSLDKKCGKYIFLKLFSEQNQFFLKTRTSVYNFCMKRSFYWGITFIFTQNYWVFGLFQSSGILVNRKYDVSETGSVSVLRWRGRKHLLSWVTWKELISITGQQWLNSCVNLTEGVQWLRLALSKGSNWVGVFSPLHLRTETDPVSETSCFLFSTIPDDERSPKIQ